MMAMIFAASALSATRSAPPADLALPVWATIAKTAPDAMLTDPPSSTDTPACIPPRDPAKSAITAVAYACHRKTVRIGLLCNSTTFSVPGVKQGLGL